MVRSFTLSPRQVFAAALLLCAGCAFAPRSEVEECRQLSRTLRSENARMKDRILVLQTQNREFAERAEDDADRLARQDQTIERYDKSVRAYQEERDRLEAAYHQLASSLGDSRAKADERLSEASPDPAASGKARRKSADGLDSADRADSIQGRTRK